MSPKWLGKCPDCGEWNTFVQEIKVPTKVHLQKRSKPQALKEIALSKETRLKTGIGELDRVLGGGIVEGSVVLIGGEPGIGKSTLILQLSNKLAKRNKKVLYVSGEESPAQIKIRAERLNISEDLLILPETNIEQIQETIVDVQPDTVVVDSIQTIYDPNLATIPGSVSQVRECGLTLMQIAKEKNIIMLMIGHVTKGGVIAGPKTLEHMVDTVLYLEGDKNYYYRILRAAKNRFGSTNEIGVFEMGEKGLSEVEDPSLFFLEQRREDSSGTVVSCTLEGTRPFLVEIQALLSPCAYGVPQRVSAGIDYRRLAMLLAVIERKLGFKVSTRDVFLNIVGGLKIEERACDLAIVAAIVSGLKDVPINKDVVVLGEVGLTGEIRLMQQLQRRMNEAERLGFRKCIIPRQARIKKVGKLELIEVGTVNEAIYKLLK